MSKVRVPIFGRLSNYVAIEANATVGATIGRDLFNADGTLFDPDALLASLAPARDPATPATGATYTDAMADARAASAIAAHEAADDPHPQYNAAAVFNRIDAAGDIRIGADGSLRITHGA